MSNLHNSPFERERIAAEPEEREERQPVDADPARARGMHPLLAQFLAIGITVAAAALLVLLFALLIGAA